MSEKKKIVIFKKDTEPPKPFLKWVGGKTQIIEAVLDNFPSTINNYYEPFVGGGSVLLALLHRVKIGRIKLHGTIYASDLNAHLISLYTQIKNEPEVLIREASLLAEEYNSIKVQNGNREPTTHEEAMESQESYYYWIRTQFNKGNSSPAKMLFLNKTGFRGMYREGPNGFNVPFGNYKTASIVEPAQIRLIAPLFANVVFTVASFNVVLSSALFNANDFIYLDPPYAPEGAKSFVGYTKDGFGLDNHRRLFELCLKLPRFLMSNANVPLVTQSFEGFLIQEIECRRAINSKNPASKTTEVFVRSAY